MNCPLFYVASSMTEGQRIEMDDCPKRRSVRLDPGELEKD